MTPEIQIRDPFIVPVPEERLYYLFGTTDKTAWSGPAVGFDCYSSPDLIHFSDPIPAFRPPQNFWATTNFWAPEVHRYQNRWVMLASFKHPDHHRGTQILTSEKITGPYLPLTPKPITPPDWECLDGTLFVAPDKTPWIVFCHEWTQIQDGAICAMPLTPDLTAPAGEPILLFNASQADWIAGRHQKSNHVTDGPFLYRAENNHLLMFWSTLTPTGYALGVASSPSGLITGPWHHNHPPLFTSDGGHGMLFKTFTNQLTLALHAPNNTPHERPIFIPLHEKNATLHLL